MERQPIKHGLHLKNISHESREKETGNQKTK